MLGIIAQTVQEVTPSSTQVLTSLLPKMRVETRVEMKMKTPEQILSLLAKTPTLTLGEIARMLDKSPSTIERAVARLKQQQKLVYRGPRKGGHWQVL